MERRRLAGMKPASLFHHRKIKKFKKTLKNEKGLQGQQLAHLFFENLSQKTRFWVIVVRKFSCYYGPTSSFLCKIFYGRWTGTGMDTIDRMDKNGLLNGRWTGTGMDTYSR
jgi:hypothetical protein